MPPVPARVFVFFHLLLILAAAGPAPAAEESSAPLVAIPAAILQKQVRGADRSIKEGAELTERVQFALQNDPALADIRFVERIALDSLVREQGLALSGVVEPGTTTDAESVSIRAGRLSRADWTLRIRLRADDLARPRIDVEVIDTLRADLIVRETTPLAEPPDESWLFLPDDEVATLATEVAARALRSASALRPLPAETRRLAPLAFVDRSPTERLAPLARLIHAALRETGPGLHVLGYEAEDEARAESALFLAGLTDLDPSAWSRVADAYVWGEFTESADYSGPVAELPLTARLRLWSDERGPREIVVTGRFGDLPTLAAAVARAVRSSLGTGRIPDSAEQRRQVARVLGEAALAMATKEKVYAARLASLALFFDPLDPAVIAAGRGALAAFSEGATWHPSAVALRRTLGSAAPAFPSPASPTRTNPTPAPASAVEATDSPASVLVAWRNQAPEALVAAAESGPVLNSPWLSPEWIELPATGLRPPEARHAFPNAPFPLGFAAGSLWFAPGAPWFFTEKLPRAGLWRLDLAEPLTTAREIIDFPPVQVVALDTAPDGALWLATRGQGLLICDPARPEQVKRIGLSEGLPFLDLQGVVRVPDARLIQRWQERESIVTAVSLGDQTVAQIRPPPREAFPNLPAGLRAAILAYGDASPPRVRLPESPALAYEQKKSIAPRPALRSRPHRSPEEQERDPLNLLSAIPTGLGDGYWAASLDTVVWAAGSRLVPLAHWIQGEISHIADDGRRLFVAVARRRDLRSLRLPPGEPDSLAIHIYDYQAGRWIGRIAAPPFMALQVGEDHMLLSPLSAGHCKLASLATLRSVAAPSLPDEPPPIKSPAWGSKEWKETSAALDRQDRLFAAINRPAADLEAMRAALAEGAEAVLPDAAAGSQPILLAARRRQWDAVELLFPLIPAEAWNARPDRKNSSRIPTSLGRQLMQLLLENQRPDLATRLLAAGADVAPLSDRPWDSLAWLAIRCGDPGLVRTLHAAGWPLSTGQSKHPLREAVAQKNAPLLLELLRLAPSSIDDSSGEGRTPLFDAADAGWAEGVRLLLDAGASDFCGDSHSGRSLHAAASPWPEVGIRLNRRPDAADNQLAGARAVAAAVSGDPAAMEAVAPDAAVLRYHDFLGWTVLHHAARHGRAALVARLLAAGAERDPLTDHGESALCMAVFNGDTATFEALLASGADVNAHRDRGWLPLHAAAAAGRSDLARALLARGADLRPAVGDRASPVLNLAAAARDDGECLRLLVEAGAPLHAVDNPGFGVLESAVVSDSAEKIQYLLDRGARWKKAFGPDYHPMDAAAKRGLTRSVRKLQQLGLQSPRALALAEDDATRAVLQDDDSEAGRRFRADEQQWRSILAEPDPVRLRERVTAHLKAGGNPSHLSAAWGTPLDVAVSRNDPELIRWLVDQGADPAIKSKRFSEGHGGAYRPLTAFHGWMEGQTQQLKQHGTLPPERDEIALAYLAVFWRHEPDPGVRKTLIRLADDAGLPRTAAWMRAHSHD